MIFKYVHHEEIGFIMWPKKDALWHSHVGHMLQNRRGGRLLSAGFVEFRKDGTLSCFGMSESLSLNSKEDDSDLLMVQLGLKEAKA